MFVIGTAGHVDHGKSLLVEALTGIDPDRLREEKARGMTIDLGFAWLTLPSGRTLSIVDVPGHERFIKNMLAGAGGIDLALLVVAADDGVMPQTREHLAILDLLGVSRGVVALTKRDLVDADWLSLVESEIAALLRDTALDGSPIVACSARTREGLDALLEAIDAALDAMPPKRNVSRPRLPIDRVFTIGGFGTVVTGTLIDGELTVGDEIEAMPGDLRGRVRGLQSHKDTVQRALPGTRTAVNLAGIDRESLRRGIVLARPGTLRSVDVMDVRFRAVASVRHNMHVTFHSGADEANAQLRLLDRDQLHSGDEAWAQIKLETPVAVLRGDRFVIRTPNDTVGGGAIVDIAPKRHRRHHPPTLAALESMLSDSPADRVLEAVARTPFSDLPTIARELQLSLEATSTAIDELLESGAVVTLQHADGALLATPELVERTRSATLGLLDAYHAAHPLRTGVPLEELRTRLHLGPRALAALIDGWKDVRADATFAARATFEPAPSAAQQAAIDAYLSALRASPERPPSIDLNPDILGFLIDRGDVVDASGGIVFDADAFASMREKVCAYIDQHGAITLAAARDLIGSSRRHAQAFLEHLDRLRVTRRVGEERVLR